MSSRPLHLITTRNGRLEGRASLYRGDRKVVGAEAHAMTDHVRFGVSLDADEPSILIAAAAGPWLSLLVPISERLRQRLADVLRRELPHKSYDDVDVFEVSVHHGSV